MRGPFATKAWIVWLLCTSILVLYLRNPLYHIIILLSALIIKQAYGHLGSALKISFWRFALVILVFSILFNVLLVHIGQTVLLELPDSLWLVGGPLTLEAAVSGAANALVLITLFAVFLTFNALVPTSELVASMPRALSNVSIVVLIAMTYVPETLAQLERVREAQAVRGHDVRGLRDWRPIVIPLLIGGLERSMNLAETMVSRGFGETKGEQLPAAMRALLLAGLVVLFTGWLLTFWHNTLGWVLFTTGGALLALAYLKQGRRSKRTRYSSEAWTGFDWMLVAVSIVPVALVLLPFPGANQNTLGFAAYPRLSLPPFDPLIGFSLALLAAPALLSGSPGGSYTHSNA
ncbi:MAG: energy-coupling factor transporter transmembrane component T [Candidatus Promineifilaceae bacterium]